MKTQVAIVSTVLILLSPVRCTAQTFETWVDYIANWNPDGSKWTYEINPGFAKAYAGAHWLDVYTASTAAYQVANWQSTEGNLEFHYTFDNATENVLEIRPWLGLNFIWATFGEYLNIFYPSFSIRLEQRFLWYQESGTQDTKTRARLRFSARFPLNNTQLVAGTYYLLFLAESYVPLDGDPREVSADKTRFQGGLGYVVGQDLRIELQYINMRQHNTYTNSFDLSSNVIWLAVRNYF